jgi:hypothetical protein
MSNPLLSEKMRRWKLHIERLELLNLDTRLFNIERRIQRLEFRWRYSEREDPHDLRMERMRVRHEFELLKIDVESLERRIQPLLESQSQAQP